MKILGVITARGGSKGIPGKNIKLLAGKPLIVYTIEAAQKSGIFDRIILSTDDEAIADVCQKHGVEVPFMRPKELAEDSTPHLPVMQHAVQWMQDSAQYKADYVGILQPTAPLRVAKHLIEAKELFEETKADSVVSMVEIPKHYSPYWAVKVEERGMGTLLLSGEPIKNRIPRRQNLPPAYINNGIIYIFRADLLNSDAPNFYGDNVAVYIMDEKFSVNIDEPRDWELVESRIKELKAEGVEI